MFNSWMFYLIIGLSATTLGLGYLSLSLHDDKVVAVEALKVSQEAVSGYQKALNNKYLSCQIDEASTVQLEAEKKGLQTQIETISNNIEKLRNSKSQAKQENVKNENLKPNVLPDDGLLSPNIVRLLQQGFCSVYPTDSDCVPK